MKADDVSKSVFKHCGFKNCDFEGADWTGISFDTPSFDPRCKGITFELARNVAEMKNPFGLPPDVYEQLDHAGRIQKG